MVKHRARAFGRISSAIIFVFYFIIRLVANEIRYLLGMQSTSMSPMCLASVDSLLLSGTLFFRPSHIAYLCSTLYVSLSSVFHPFFHICDIPREWLKANLHFRSLKCAARRYELFPALIFRVFFSLLRYPLLF